VEVPLTPGDLVDSFRKARKPAGSRSVGIEIEKMAVDSSTGLPLPYEGGTPSIRSVLEFLAGARRSRAVLEEGAPIGLEGDWGSITLEPGGQIEWSSPRARTLGDLKRLAEAHLSLLASAERSLGIRWLEPALQPHASLAEMPWMPKRRYRIMRDYFRTRGVHAHRMMTQTASVQVTLDYSSEEDWSEKFRAGFLLAPLAVAGFANSRVSEGRDSGYASFRSHIWRHTDDDRCGAPDFVFKERFGFRDWVEYLLDLPTMFVARGGELRPAAGVPYRLVLTGEWDGHPATHLDWELHLSEVFTEVRTKSTHIELRSCDLPPDDLIMAVPAFWAGLLEGAGTRDEAVGLLGWEGPSARPTRDAWAAAMEEASRGGIAGRIRERPAGDLFVAALSLARSGLAAFDPEGALLLDRLRERPPA